MFALASPASAGVLLSQTGAIRGAGGAAVDGTYDMVFTLYASEVSVNAIWSEYHPDVPVKQGVFALVLGGDEPLAEATVAANPTLWMGVSVGGEPELPRRPIASVAFTAVAAYADTALALAGPVPSLDCSGCIETNDLAKNAVTSDKIAAGAIQPYHVSFPYAGSASQGGPATLAQDVNCKGCVSLEELSFTPASLAEVAALGPSLDDLGCKVGESPQKGLSGWTCAKVQLQGLSGGNANGYELIDGMGYTWDGLERPAVDHETARQACEAAGARLPTVGELYRNRATAPGSVGQAFHGSWLWTLVARTATQTMISRLSDGSVTHSDNATVRNYRCVWPDYTSKDFDGDHCMGGCWTTPDGTLNVDAVDRPRMPLLAAIRECAAVNARVPDLWELESAIRAGLPNGSAGWVWTGDQYKASYGGPPFVVVNWQSAAVSWFPKQTLGGVNSYNGVWADDGGTVGVRCIGLRSRGTLNAPAGGDFSSPAQALSAESSDALPLDYFSALDDCRSQGGHIPDNIEALGLVAAGWPGGSQLGIWTAEHHDLPMITLFWKATEPGFFPGQTFVATGSGFGTSLYSSASYYRCAWYRTRAWTDPDQCKGGCFVSSKGGAVAAIDKQDREPATYFDAVDGCRALGARLPTARDMEELLRSGAPGGSGTGIWTSSTVLLANNGPANKLVVRWSGTDTKWFPANAYTSGPSGYQNAATSGAMPYRCVWTNEVY